MSENNWKEALKRVSLMGLNAVEIPPELMAFFQKQGIQGEPAPQILAGISLLSLQEKGQHPFKKTKKGTNLKPFPKEGEYLSPYQNGLLSQILNKNYQWAMYEFLNIIEAQKKLIPAFRIPDLIHYAQSETWLKPWIEPMTGIQGAWALSHIPRWEKNYLQISNDHWRSPQSIEKKVFPLLNLKSPLPNILHILPLLEIPGKIWTPKFSQSFHRYMLTCLKLPNIDLPVQEDLEEIIHYASYLTDPTQPIYFDEDGSPDKWVATLIRYNLVLGFRERMGHG